MPNWSYTWIIVGTVSIVVLVFSVSFLGSVGNSLGELPSRKPIEIPEALRKQESTYAYDLESETGLSEQEDAEEATGSTESSELNEATSSTESGELDEATESWESREAQEEETR
jgi:hypothetical protein